MYRVNIKDKDDNHTSVEMPANQKRKLTFAKQGLTIEDVNASGLWPGKVVTEVEPVGDFWAAEPEHQDYLQRLPNGYTCHFARPDWVLPKRDKAAE